MRVTVEDENGKVTIEGGAVAKGTEAAAWDGSSIAAKLIKTAPERRYTLHCAYPADKPDAVVAADGYRDFASKEAVEEAAWAFMTKHRKIGAWHKDGTEDAGSCVESYVYRGPDWCITAKDGSEHVVKEGDWMVGIVWSDQMWSKVLSGEIGGVSMQGSAVRKRPAPERLAALRR